MAHTRTSHALQAPLPTLPQRIAPPQSRTAPAIPQHITPHPRTHPPHHRLGAHTTLATSSNGPVILQSPLQEGEELRQWVEFNGGYVHPALVLVADAPCGAARGVIITEAVDPIIDDTTNDVLVDAAPLIAVPERILMTSADARAVFASRLREAQHPNVGVLYEIDPALQLGMLVASERSKGRASFYWPYIESLPRQPPCPWMLETDQDMQASIVGAVGTHKVREWLPQVRKAREAVDFQAEAVLSLFGEVFTELNPGDVRWATAQVLSRCFGQGDDIALLPFIDLCNHSSRADPPDGRAEDTPGSDDPNMVDAFACAFAARDGQPVSMQPGDELFINYQAAGSMPLTVFLNFGFVPEELADAPELQPKTIVDTQ